MTTLKEYLKGKNLNVAYITKLELVEQGFIYSLRIKKKRSIALEMYLFHEDSMSDINSVLYIQCYISQFDIGTKIRCDI